MSVNIDKKKEICDAILASDVEHYKTRNTLPPKIAFRTTPQRGFLESDYEENNTQIAEIRVRLGLDRDAADEMYGLMKQNKYKKSLAGVPIQASYVNVDGQKERCWFSIGPSGEGNEVVKLKFPKPVDLDKSIDYMVGNIGKIVSNGIVGNRF